jgi:toxin ParE1/3/4
MNIVFRRKALADLRGIFAYIKQDNIQSATDTVAFILDSIEKLREFPLLGGVVPRTRELVIGGAVYTCIYKVNKDAVEVVAIFHGAQRRA